MTPALLLALLSGVVGTGEDPFIESDFGEVVGFEAASLQGYPRQRGRSASASKAWNYFAVAPYKGPRHNAWHSLFNTPPLEEALVLPKGMYNIRGMLDINSSGWSENKEGGRSQYNAVYVAEIVEFNYGWTEQLLVGARLTVGELGEGDDELLRVFEGGQQIIPTGKRGWGISDLVLRGKYAGSLGAADFAVLGELKIPLASEDDYLTAQTMDLGVSAILSKRWQRFALHVNLGFVMPVSDPELFSIKDDVAFYLHGGVAAGYRIDETITGLLQIQFNSNAFDGASVVEANVKSILLGGRYKYTDTLFLSGALGKGLGDDSGDLSFSLSIDHVF